tara:strand:+ start:681 stop:1385 length:705 start_codon:yes stop_codon:yes gene_type:complete
MSIRKQVTLLLIATKQYKQFVQPLIEGVKKYFLINHDVTVELFTDEIRPYEGDERVKVSQTLIASYAFPEVTLYRYKIFLSKKHDCDYIYYLDVDMAIVSEVGEEIFGDIVAVRHPGFYLGGGSWCDDKNSLAYTEPENRYRYYAGGFQGGGEKYYRAMKQMALHIDEDVRNGVLATWHDESHWNKYLSECKIYKELSPAYCLVEQQELREKWGISEFEPKIIALAKDHKTIRE